MGLRRDSDGFSLCFGLPLGGKAIIYIIYHQG